MSLLELLRKSGMDQDVDFLKEGLQLLAQALVEAEVTQQIGADRYERSGERTTQRNGFRTREWDTRVGTLDLQAVHVFL
ncbi:transposase, partial [Paenibacillus naphthalenovorans]|uniref:transposase n=1 Tax=Paenibacillus naphthalenovorans TaxID=162209 RepID=UPI003D283322